METSVPRPPYENTRYLDRATLFMSGGWDAIPEYRQLLHAGEQALPFLVTELLCEVPDSDSANQANLPKSSWWRLDIIWSIANQAGKTIVYEPETLGIYDEVKMQTIAWAVVNGYIDT